MKRILFDYVFLLLVLVILPHGCAKPIQGTPVKNLPHLTLTTDQLSASFTTKEDLARMSKVAENAAFTEKRGYPEYKIGPLDILEITSRIGSEHKTYLVIVRSDGTISYSFVDDLPVEGLTVREIDEKLTERLSAFVRKPRIDIIVKEFNSKSALVMGEIGSLRYA